NGFRAASASPGQNQWVSPFRTGGICVALFAIQMERSKNTKGENMNNNKKHNFSTWIVAVGLTAIAAAGCAGGPLTAREKGAGIGALGGAAVGGAIGSAKGHPGTGPRPALRQR